MNKIESINLIYRNPEVRGGRPCLVGTGLRVIDIVMAMQFGNRSPEQMAEDYQVSLAKVHAALAFYYENKEEIDEDIREDIRIGLELAQEGWGRPEKSIFPLGLTPDQLDALVNLITRAEEEADDDQPLTRAMKRQMVEDFVAGKAIAKAAESIG
ncbi:MAG: DUF433 domain-containing protein [Chloroflexi bacterium]|nr:DUF433 domain-containing protein [Chloroflexota bacterium]